MPRADLFDISGKKLGKINLPIKVFQAKVNPQLMAQAVRVYLSNQRKAHPIARTRSEVRRTTAKWYAQKGTGKARHGSRSAPIFVGGGVAHGPKGIENYKLKMSKKMRKASLFSALTSKLKSKKILVVEGLEKIKPKTKDMVKLFKDLKIEDKVLIILPAKLENVIRAARNIKNTRLVQASVLNTYQVLNYDKIVLLKESLKKL